MNIFLADSSADVRLALQMLLDNEPGMEITGLTVRTEGLLAQVEASAPDVLLLDWALPGKLPAALLADLERMEHRPKVLVLSVNASYEQSALGAGADAFVWKAAGANEMMVILRRWRDEIRKNRFA